jgi:hypothetical protein
MADENDCREWLDEVGQCDLKEGHLHETPHVSVSEDAFHYTKTIWPVAPDDPDVKRYIAVGEAAIAEDDRQMAEQAAATGRNADA